jgi:hypothetical protein
LSANTYGQYFLSNFAGVELRDANYMHFAPNYAPYADLIPTTEIQPASMSIVYGIRNACNFTLDVLDRASALSAETAEASHYAPVGASAPYVASVIKHFSATNPWIALVDGWRIADLQQMNHRTLARARIPYYYNVFSHVFASLCDVQGPPFSVDIPEGSTVAADYVRLLGNPSRAEVATIAWSLSRPDRITVGVYDVAGRLVRTVADRKFPAGEHTILWDGSDASGSRAGRGMYFVRVRHGETGKEESRKLVMLR